MPYYKQKKSRFEQRHRVRFSATATPPMRRKAQPVVEVPPGLRRALLVVMPLIVALVAGAWFFGDVFRVKAVVVQGNDNVPKAQIEGVSGLVGQHPLFVNAASAAQAISKLPGVSGVVVNCGWSGECVVTVRPAQPLAVYRSASGLNDVWVDALGKVQKVTGDINPQLVVRVEQGDTPAVGSPMDTRTMRAMNELLQLQPTVTTYLFSADYGMMFTDEKGTRIRLGTAEHDGAMQQKIALAGQLRDQLAARGITPRIIDVRFVDAPYYVR